MPSKSEKQRRLMEAACANPSVARKRGIKRSVACEFRAADRARLRKRKRARGKKSRKK